MVPLDSYRGGHCLDQLNHTFADRVTLQSALDNQPRENQHEFDRTRYIVRKLMKLRVHEDAQPFIEHIITLRLGLYLNGSWNEKFFHFEMATRTNDTALDQLNHIIDATFADVEKVESYKRYTTLQWLYTPLNHCKLNHLKTARWTDESTWIRSYPIYNTNVLGLEATNPYD